MTEPIRYTVDLADRDHHLVRVAMQVPAALARGARLVLPVWTPGSYLVRNYARHVQWIRASSEGADVAVAPDGVSAWIVDGDGTSEVTVTLELYANELTVRTSHVDDHHALLVPAATFPYLDGATDRPCEVTIQPVPDHHRVFSLLPPAARAHTFRADDRDHLVDSAFEIGDLPSVRWQVAGVDHELVWAGHAPAPDLDTIAADVTAIAEAAIAVFDDGLPAPAFTVLCLGWSEGGGGLEHRDGAVLQVPVRTFTDPDLTARFQSLLAHEYLHLWNVKRLVPAALVAPDYEHPTHCPSLWVAEGWTAYYDDLLPARAGLWPVRRLLDMLGDTLQAVEDTPGVRLQPLRRASHEAWIKHYVRDENTPNAATDYYAHGAMVAWELDLRLRTARPDGDGLDEVLRLLWRRHAGSPAGYREQDVLAAIADVGGEAIAGLADLRAGTAAPPALDEDLLDTVGLRWVDRDEPSVPDLGVHVEEDERGVRIVSALRSRPAWSAGVSGGDRLLAIDGVVLGRAELTRALRAYEPGQRVALTLARGPRLLTRTVELGEPRRRRRVDVVAEPTDLQRQAFARWTGRPLEPID